MLIKKRSDIKSSEITDRSTYLNRRKFLIDAAGSLVGIAAGISVPRLLDTARDAHAGVKLNGVRKSPLSTDETPNSLKDITTYNNFYEFGTDKYSPAKYAKSLVTRPWTVAVEGEIKHPKVYDIDELTKISPLEERIYRLAAWKAGRWSSPGWVFR